MWNMGYEVKGLAQSLMIHPAQQTLDERPLNYLLHIFSFTRGNYEDVSSNSIQNHRDNPSIIIIYPCVAPYHRYVLSMIQSRDFFNAFQRTLNKVHEKIDNLLISRKSDHVIRETHKCFLSQAHKLLRDKIALALFSEEVNWNATWINNLKTRTRRSVTEFAGKKTRRRSSRASYDAIESHRLSELSQEDLKEAEKSEKMRQIKVATWFLFTTLCWPNEFASSQPTNRELEKSVWVVTDFFFLWHSLTNTGEWGQNMLVAFIKILLRLMIGQPDPQFNYITEITSICTLPCCI